MWNYTCLWCFINEDIYTYVVYYISILKLLMASLAWWCKEPGHQQGNSSKNMGRGPGVLWYRIATVQHVSWYRHHNKIHCTIWFLIYVILGSQFDPIKKIKVYNTVILSILHNKYLAKKYVSWNSSGILWIYEDTQWIRTTLSFSQLQNTV